MKSIITILFACFMFFSQAKAGLYLDPGIGLNFNGGLESSGNFDNDLDNSPLTVAAKFGYSSMGLFFGLDYAMTMGMDFENNTDDFDMTEYGIVVGYEFPIMFRVWAAYMLGGELENTANTFEDMDGIKLGFGYTGLPFVSLNFEMKDYSFGELNNTNGETDFSTYLLSLSFPLSL